MYVDWKNNFKTSEAIKGALLPSKSEKVCSIFAEPKLMIKFALISRTILPVHGRCHPYFTDDFASSG
jgi:hypothetical protein